MSDENRESSTDGVQQERRSGEDRRKGGDRRKDRSAPTLRRLEERRQGPDRRSGKDRRKS